MMSAKSMSIDNVIVSRMGRRPKSKGVCIYDSLCDKQNTIEEEKQLKGYPNYPRVRIRQSDKKDVKRSSVLDSFKLSPHMKTAKAGHLKDGKRKESYCTVEDLFGGACEDQTERPVAVRDESTDNDDFDARTVENLHQTKMAHFEESAKDEYKTLENRAHQRLGSNTANVSFSGDDLKDSQQLLQNQMKVMQRSRSKIDYSMSAKDRSKTVDVQQEILSHTNQSIAQAKKRAFLKNQLKMTPKIETDEAVKSLTTNLNFKKSCIDTRLRTNQGFRFASSQAQRIQQAMNKNRDLESEPTAKCNGTTDEKLLNLRPRDKSKELSGEFRFQPRSSIERVMDRMRDSNPINFCKPEQLIASHL